MDLDWAGLATAVRRKRDLLRLRQSDLEQRGGPSTGTVRNIETGTRTKYSPRTLVQLEQALEWSPGLADRILRGTATQQEIDGTPMPAAVPREGYPEADDMTVVATAIQHLSRNRRTDKGIAAILALQAVLDEIIAERRSDGS